MAGGNSMRGAESGRRTTIAEVWGDTLDIGHLGWAVLIGARQEEVLNQLASENGGLGSVSDLPAATVKEMKELALYDLFARHDRLDVETTAENARPHGLGASL